VNQVVGLVIEGKGPISSDISGRWKSSY